MEMTAKSAYSQICLIFGRRSSKLRYKTLYVTQLAGYSQKDFYVPADHLEATVGTMNFALKSGGFSECITMTGARLVNGLFLSSQ
jgi:hypothetical protein